MKNPLELLQYVVNFLSVGKEELARALLYDIISGLEVEDNRVEIYPMTATSQEMVKAVQNLVAVCMRDHIPSLTINISLPSVEKILDIHPKVRVGLIPEFTEEGYETLKVELRKVFDSWNEKILEEISAMEGGENAKIVLLMEKLHRNEDIDFSEVPINIESDELKTLVGWFNMAIRFLEVMTDSERELLKKVNKFLEGVDFGELTKSVDE